MLFATPAGWLLPAGRDLASSAAWHQFHPAAAWVLHPHMGGVPQGAPCTGELCRREQGVGGPCTECWPAVDPPPGKVCPELLPCCPPGVFPSRDDEGFSHS